MSEPSEAFPLQKGQVVASKYRIDEPLGAGGMGVVVAATHLQLGRRVAMKIMLPSALAMPIAASRFEREARAVVQLRGEHVAQVLDVGTLPTGAPYLVMDLLEGADLGTILEKQGPLPIEDAVDYVIQACEAVAEAHAAGIIHRDLKPQNLFLTRRLDQSPLVKVLDFGVSKWTHAGMGNHSLTRTTDAVGSPNYMSPEQIRSAKEVDGRTDIWSLGVVLFELITGRVPFVATSLPQLCAMVLEDEPPRLMDIHRGVPENLSRVVATCLAKSPDDRFASVADLVEALEPHAPARSRGAVTAVHMLSSRPGLASRASASRAEAHVSSNTNAAWTEAASPSKRARTVANVTFGIVAVGVLAGALVVAPAWMKRRAAARAIDSKRLTSAASSAPAAALGAQLEASPAVPGPDPSGRGGTEATPTASAVWARPGGTTALTGVASVRAVPAVRPMRTIGAGPASGTPSREPSPARRSDDLLTPDERK